jgi:hypothetical protein
LKKSKIRLRRDAHACGGDGYMKWVHILFSLKRIILFKQDNPPGGQARINKIIYFLLINPAERGTQIL